MLARLIGLTFWNVFLCLNAIDITAQLIFCHSGMLNGDVIFCHSGMLNNDVIFCHSDMLKIDLNA